MTRLHFSFILIAACLAACSQGASEGTHTHGPAETGHAEIVKGPHGGRLLQSGDFALEVTIFERGVRPEFRLYSSVQGQPVKPSEVNARITLTRLTGIAGGTTDQHVFKAVEDYLASPAEVYEPHSFSVRVQAQYAGQNHEWQYDSPEGRVQIASDMATAQGLQTGLVQAGVIRDYLSLYGGIEPDSNRVRAVTARFPGIVRSVGVQAGDRVKAGQTLATIESNESLQVYAVTAPLAGTVTRRDTNPGESAGSAPLFEIADFSRVRAELSVFPRDRARLQPGQTVEVSATDGAASAGGTVDFISPAGGSGQSVTVRVMLDNGSGQWTPGQFVNARVAVRESPARLVVPLSALQTFREWDVVFVSEGDRYQALPVTLGRRDEQHAEVLEGLVAGTRIVTGNSYLVKADIEKSGAEHDH